MGSCNLCHVIRKRALPASRSEYLKAYRIMLMARVLEEKLASLYRAGLIKGASFLDAARRR